MKNIWAATLENLSAQVARGPTPAAVSVAALCAVLALDLTTMAIQVSARRARDDSDQSPTLMEQIRLAKARLQRAADEDISAYNDYLAQRRRAKAAPDGAAPEALAAALGHAIEVPLEAAEAATQGLRLCADAARIAHPVVRADLAAALLLLDAAVQAMLLSAGANLEPPAPQGALEALRRRHNALARAAQEARDAARRVSPPAQRKPPTSP